MIRPPGWDGVAFSERADGDIRGDRSAQIDLARRLHISDEWATVRQVHGNEVRRVDEAGDAGEADALWTIRSGLPLAIYTADCLGVVLAAEGAVGVAHAGWRGAGAGVVTRLAEEMGEAGYLPWRAAIGPGIGPCCFEVGAEVASLFPDYVSNTTWETTSVDLAGVVAGQLEGVPGGVDVWSAAGCTRHEDGWFSHRADGTSARMATIGWFT
jgi:YfiH family protein